MWEKTEFIGERGHIFCHLTSKLFRFPVHEIKIFGDVCIISPVFYMMRLVALRGGRGVGAKDLEVGNVIFLPLFYFLKVFFGCEVL